MRLITATIIVLLSTAVLPANAQVGVRETQMPNPIDPGPTTPPDVRSETYRMVEQMPAYDGELSAWLSKNMKYPADALKANAEGRAVVQFIVRKDGSISNAEVVRSAGQKDLDEEALRLVRAMPKWKPGKQNGVAVNVFFSLPITFQLD